VALTDAAPPSGDAPAGRAECICPTGPMFEGPVVDCDVHGQPSAAYQAGMAALDVEADRLLDQRDRARATAVHLEQQLALVAALQAAVAALHGRVAVRRSTPTGVSARWQCQHCRVIWPCPTARALGVEP